MLAFCQETAVDQEGGVAEEVTEDQLGSPERLGWLLATATRSLDQISKCS